MVRGDWNKIDDANTLIDVGTDDYVLKAIEPIPTGVGKSKIEQIILTHEHFDHAAGLKYILQLYKPKVYAFNDIKGVTHKAYDGLRLQIADREAEIFHTPGHSHDSICVFVPEEKTLFSGDTPLNVKSPGGSYSQAYVESLERLVSLDITKVFSGHDEPIINNANKILRETLKNVKMSKIF